jgi:hypothetical protein
MRFQTLIMITILATLLLTTGIKFAFGSTTILVNGEHNQCGSSHTRTGHDCGEHNKCGSANDRLFSNCGDRKGCLLDPDDCNYTEPTIFITTNGVVFDQGQPITFTFTVYGGIGPFNVELFNITGNKQQDGNVIIFSPGGSNSITIIAGAVGTFSFNAIATDTGITPPFVFNSV